MLKNYTKDDTYYLVVKAPTNEVLAVKREKGEALNAIQSYYLTLNFVNGAKEFLKDLMKEQGVDKLHDVKVVLDDLPKNLLKLLSFPLKLNNRATAIKPGETSFTTLTDIHYSDSMFGIIYYQDPLKVITYEKANTSIRELNETFNLGYEKGQKQPVGPLFKVYDNDKKLKNKELKAIF